MIKSFPRSAMASTKGFPKIGGPNDLTKPTTERQIIPQVTNDVNHSKSEIERPTTERQMVNERISTKSDWRIRFYPTFGTKYPYTEVTDESTSTPLAQTTESIDDLQRQLFDALDKLAEKHSDHKSSLLE